MPRFKQGDRVRIVTRPATSEDSKTGLYFPHYAGLPGTVRHVYGDEEVAVEVDLEALPVEVRARHQAIRDQMKTRWLEGMSEEGRAKLTEREKDFHLRYVVLVAAGDLEPEPGDRRPQKRGEESPAAAEEAPRRPTTEDLNRAEEEELLRRRGSRTR